MRGKDWIELADFLALYDPETLDKLARHWLMSQSENGINEKNDIAKNLEKEGAIQ
jgi:hypothetical protein